MSNIDGINNLFNKISTLIEQARTKVAMTINQEMVVLYWNIGRVVKDEIIRSERAEYGKQIVQSLSAQLTQRYGRGFSSQNLWHMVRFYETYPILSALRREFEGLSWTHIKTLLYIKDDLKRKFYTALCVKEYWSTRILEKRIDSMVYERTALSKLPEKAIKMQLKELKEEDKMTPEIVFRDPYVLDFLELSDTYSEKDLEKAILNALEKFIIHNKTAAKRTSCREVTQGHTNCTLKVGGKEGVRRYLSIPIFTFRCGEEIG